MGGVEEKRGANRKTDRKSSREGKKARQTDEERDANKTPADEDRQAEGEVLNKN